MIAKNGHNVLPKLTYKNSDKLLPNQEDIEFYSSDFKIKEITINKTINNPIINFLLLMATPSFFATAFFIFLFYHSFLLFAYLKLNPYFVFCTTLAIVFKKIVLFIIGLMSNN